MSKNSKEIKFEEAIDELEKIVHQMENGQVSLEESLKKYEDAMRLIRNCQGVLAKAEKKIEILQKKNDSEYGKIDASVDDFKEDKKETKDNYLF